MFANFASRRHLAGPLRAVSPVESDNTEIDWKTANKALKRRVGKLSRPAPSANALKLTNYFQGVFKGTLPLEKSRVKDILELTLVEAVSLFIPLLYIGVVFFGMGALTWFVSGPMIENLIEENYLNATYWAAPSVLALGVFYRLTRPMFGGFRRYHGRVLRRHEAPAFFSLVQEMSRHLGVVPPRRIEINNETALRVDSYAGVNSIYRDEYKIIIGAPLLMGMSVNHLAAMLAHELSHFRDKHKKVAFYLMHHVSEWLFFRATGQDRYHQALLKRMQKENLSRVEYAELWSWQRLYIFQQAIFMALFKMHRAATSWKCRQIELETDAVAVKLAGVKDFTGMLRRLRHIQTSQSAVTVQNDWAWKEGVLLDNYALALAIEAKNAERNEKRNFEAHQEEEVTRFCPSDRVRVDAANEIVSKGVLVAQVQASLLIEDAKQLCKELTVLDYESTGIIDAQKYCLSAEKIRLLKHNKEKLNRVAQQYFDGRVDERVLKFEPSEERDVSQFDVQMSIDYIRRYRVEDRKQQGAAKNLLKRIYRGYVVKQLEANGLSVKRYLSEESGKDMREGYLEHMRSQYQQALYHMESMDQVFYQRASDAMRYLDIVSRNEASLAFHNLELYSQVRREIAALYEAHLPLAVIVNGLKHGVSTKILQAGVSEKQVLWRLIHRLREELKGRPIGIVLHRKKVHLLAYLDFKLGELPDSSSEMTIEEMASYLSDLLSLLSFQYHKWQAQVAKVLAKFERENDIAQINLLK